MGRFYALLVGINEYASTENKKISNLSGCLHDVERLKSYLEKIPEAERKIFEPLTNEKATKAAVVSAIHDQLGEAGPEDTALFYFSGHGCREDARDSIRRFTVGNKIEALVCHDSFAGGESTTLADLELRYLFQQLASKENPPGRIVIITDSCNSGGVTRSLFNTKIRLGPIADQRDWKQFLFATENEMLDNGLFKKHAEEEFSKSSSLNAILPKARHIHLAACESQQSAFEKSEDGGIFTKSLLTVLENTGGSISFRDLHSRIKYRVRRDFKDQTPQIYSYDPARDPELGAGQPPDLMPIDLMDTDFLKGLSVENRLDARVEFYHGKWMIDKGAIHGIPPKNIASKKIQIQVVEAIKDQEDAVKVENAEILSVLPGTTQFGFIPINLLDSEHPEKYKAKIKGLYLEPLVVQRIGDEAAFNLKDDTKDYGKLLAERNIKWLSDSPSSNPNYKLIANKEEYLITSPRDPDDIEKARPLCQQIPRRGDNAVPKLVHFMSTIARWHFVQGLRNPRPKTDVHTQIDWEILWTPATCVLHNFKIHNEQLFEEQRLNPDKGRSVEALKDQIDYPTVNIDLPPPASADRTSYVYFRIRMHNRSREPLFVSLLYLGQLFEIRSNNFQEEGNVVRLDGGTDDHPGNSVWAFGTVEKGMPFVLSQFIYDNNWEEETFFLKLIISNTQFDLGNTFEQAGLPPPGPITKGSGDKDSYKSATHPEIPDWTTKMVEIRIKNPKYKSPSQT